MRRRRDQRHAAIRVPCRHRPRLLPLCIRQQGTLRPPPEGEGIRPSLDTEINLSAHTFIVDCAVVLEGHQQNRHRSSDRQIHREICLTSAVQQPLAPPCV